MSVDVMARFQVRKLLCSSLQLKGTCRRQAQSVHEAYIRRRPVHQVAAPAAQRLRGREVTMVTGTDEHGEKIAISAAKAGLEPKAHCDAVVAEYKALWQLVCGDSQFCLFVCCLI